MLNDVQGELILITLRKATLLFILLKSISSIKRKYFFHKFPPENRSHNEEYHSEKHRVPNREEMVRGIIDKERFKWHCHRQKGLELKIHYIRPMVLLRATGASGLAAMRGGK